MKKSVLFFLLLAGTLLLAGCQKELKGGKEAVRFSASSHPGTKTAYSGVVDDDDMERIDWVVDDQIRIFSDKAEHRYNAGQHWADYVIKSVTPDGYMSKGVIDNVPGDGTGNGLVWDEEGTYKFYAIYPPTASEQGAAGKFDVKIPGTQNIDVTSGTPDMKNAIMTAAQSVSQGDLVKLPFEPAYTAFEFTFDSDIELKLSGIKLAAADGSPALAGSYYIQYDDNLAATYVCTAADENVIYGEFSSAPTISAGNSFKCTLFALPQDLSGLSLSFSVQAPTWSIPEVRTLKLNYKNGSPVEFPAGGKYKISGTMQGSWSFKLITLNGVAAEWTGKDITVATNDTPQSSQFVVNGVQNVYQIHNEDNQYKKLRQTWVLGANTATVSFKVFSPVNGTYEVQPFVKKADGTIEEGSTGFDVAGSLSGAIGGTDHEHYATMVEFTVKVNGAAAGDQLFFKTFVTNGGVTQSLDSETQLYDARGYHYFVEEEPSL